ncbi:MAG TPA: hypothetical protein VL485_12870 [Ktedonobacteraceae bacterium]|jgi:chromosome segregation ATPase|nr:hypothetical protein [Ktedonobacteraceae bacterium]
MGFSEDDFNEGNESGSDDLLSDDFLRLPEHANILVRIHAVRAWLTRRLKETEIEVGEATLALQELQIAVASFQRRREREQQGVRMQHLQQEFHDAQERLRGFQDADELLEENIAHVTSSERALVEYYLSLEEIMHSDDEERLPATAAWLTALSEVQHRIEYVGIPNEE